MTIISQGAEAILEREGDLLYKKRIAKPYRHEKLDEFLRKTRTKREVKVLKLAANLGILVPEILPGGDKFIIHSPLKFEFLYPLYF